MAILIRIADAVVVALNAASFSQQFTAKRHYRPRFDLAEMRALHVSVVPKGVTSEIQSRSQAAGDYQVDVGVQKRIAEEADLDPLMTLVEEVADHFRFARLALPGGEQAVWLRTESDPVYAPEHLDELRQLTSVLTLTFRVVR